ncbi:MAG: T9SS type A sorting domain-containing protein [bacterium]|nr:MAG: T9SS type A sorting domain-containing protein [bacterium]
MVRVLQFLMMSILLLGTVLISVNGLAERSRERQPGTPATVLPSSQLLPPALQGAEQLPFFDNFETGAPGWMYDGQFNLIQNAQNYMVLNPGINPTLVTLPDNGQLPVAISPSHMFWFGQTATGTFIGSGWDTLAQYLKNGGTSVEIQTGTLISPPIDLSTAPRAQLRFKTWWEIEGVDVDGYDLMAMSISTDNGMTWNPIGRGLLNPLNDVDGESWKPYSSGGLGQPGIWLDQAFDLTPWIGNTVRLGFTFDSVDELYNGFRGWFIDDVGVSSDPFPAPNITSISPSTVSPLEIVNIAGENFYNGAVVSVADSVVSAIISTNLAQIEAPQLSPGSYDVTITNPDGQFDTVVNGLTITDVLPPQISSIMPDSVEFGMSIPVTVFGSDFVSGSVVDIGGFPLLNQSLVNSFTITGDIPPGLPGGYHNVTVTNPDGQFDRLILAFHVYGATGIGDNTSGFSLDRFQLFQNYPNPFNPVTKISFILPRATSVNLTVYDINGQEVSRTLVGILPAGYQSLPFSGENLPSGIYFYRITAGEFSAMKKFVLLK